MPSPKPATPPVNVWNVRRENLTARAVDVDEHDWPQVGQSRPPQTVVFGSIDTCNPASTPSSPPPRVDTLERPFSPFSIGVGSHDRVPARVRSRTRDKSKPQSGKKWTFGTTDEPAQDPDLQVKNYGYGFGDPNRPDYAPAVSRAEQIARQREWDMARAREREMLQQQNDAALEDAQHANGRPPRRGTASNGRGYGDRGYRRGGSNGRGQANGFNPRGRGYRSSARPPPFTLTPPPPPFQPPLQPPDPYYPYSPYEQYPAPPAVPPPHQLAPPMPVPLTTLSFPLDATRWHLLGQLEYYLSPQNMAQDFFLRQQMDSRGWIPISLLASFNRVKQLTLDQQLVREVLSLSSLVQVRRHMVRMGGWEAFVLPDAAPSTMEEDISPVGPMYGHGYGMYDPYMYPPPPVGLAPPPPGLPRYGPPPPGIDPTYPGPSPPGMLGYNLALTPPPPQLLSALPVSPYLHERETQFTHGEEEEEEEVVFVMGEAGSTTPWARSPDTRGAA